VNDTMQLHNNEVLPYYCKCDSPGMLVAIARRKCNYDKLYFDGLSKVN